jgi:hypothetical protein
MEKNIKQKTDEALYQTVLMINTYLSVGIVAGLVYGALQLANVIWLLF